MADDKPKNDQAKGEQPMVLFRQQLEQRLDTYGESLPPQITVGHFKGVIMRAVMADPALLGADRVSLFESALAAANDGLLPDKREGAFVIYRSKVREGKKSDGKEIWIDKVQWMPMIRGIFTKLYNTGQVRTAKVAIVYGGDHFRAWTDDAGDHIEYEEADKQDRNTVRTAFAHVVMKDGGVFVETMKPADIEKIRSKSKAKDSGPWVDWWEEMAKKSVFRRLAKRLPMSREIMPLIERDNVLYNLDPQKQIEHRPVKSLSSRLDDLAGVVDLGQQEPDPVGRDKPQGSRKQSSEKSGSGSPSGSGEAGQTNSSRGATADKPSSDDPSRSDDGSPIERARAAGRQARSDGLSRKAIPAEYRGNDELRDAYLDAFDSGDETEVE